MLAWMDDEAERRTRETGEAWFWSRSRQGLWRKGATSGNVLAVEELRDDCDGDALLVRVRGGARLPHRLALVLRARALADGRRARPRPAGGLVHRFARGRRGRARRAEARGGGGRGVDRRGRARRAARRGGRGRALPPLRPARGRGRRRRRRRGRARAAAELARRALSRSIRLVRKLLVGAGALALLTGTALVFRGLRRELALRERSRCGRSCCRWCRSGRSQSRRRASCSAAVASRAPRGRPGATSRAEELDRAQDLLVRHRADAQLEQEAVVPEELVLEEDLLDHLVRAADEVRAAQGRGRRRSPAAASAASRARGRSGSSSLETGRTSRPAPAASSRR